jgi:hypothetical protein
VGTLAVMSKVVRIAAVAATAVLFASYVAVGHGMHAPNEGMKSMHGDGICLVLFTLALALAVAAVRRRVQPPTPAARSPLRLLPLVPVFAAAESAPAARASPAQLQVFRR